MKPTAKHESMAALFNALAHPRRQMLFQVLRESGKDGMAFHHLLKRTGLTPPTLAFHLKKMQEGRILLRKVKGAETWLSLNSAPVAQFPAL